MATDTVKYSDIPIAFSRHPVSTDLSRTVEFEAVRRSVRNLILTNKYERLLDPKIGANVNALLFEPMSPETTITLHNTIEETIRNYEPRALLSNILVTPDYDRQTYYITIKFSLKYTNQTTTLELFLDRIR